MVSHALQNPTSEPEARNTHTHTPSHFLDMAGKKKNRELLALGSPGLGKYWPNLKERALSSSAIAGGNENAIKQPSPHLKGDVVINTFLLLRQHCVKIDAAFLDRCKTILHTTGVPGTKYLKMSMDKEGDGNASLEALIDARRKSIFCGKCASPKLFFIV